MTTFAKDFPLVGVLVDVPRALEEVDCLVVACGFEDRAFRVLENARFGPKSHCVLIRFINQIVNNKSYFDKYVTAVRRHLVEERIHVVILRESNAEQFSRDLDLALGALPRDVRAIAIDVSGMPSYIICIVLNRVREHRSREPQMILYTSASEYTPTKTEYDEIIAEGHDEIELLPRSMALEMAENLVLEAFSGYRSQGAKSCLVVFAGYEAHRTAGIVDAINPSILLLLYGRPGDSKLEWRLDLSKRLHKKFERGRRAATEVVSTLEVRESLEVLDRYYNYLIDDYDLVIAPIGSKMHSVAAYLFWERFGEVQLTFPIPISYNPQHCPQGASVTYQLKLDPKRSLFREVLVAVER